MSELQAALLAIGLGMIVAVYVYGWWQQRKYRKKFGEAFKSSHADALYREKPPLPGFAEQPAETGHVTEIRHPAEVEHHLGDLTLELAVESAAPVASMPDAAEAVDLESAGPAADDRNADARGEDVEVESVAMPDEPGADDEALPVRKAVIADMTVAAQDEGCALLDAGSDFIIELKLDEPAPASVLGGFWQRKFDFGKPVQVCGLTLGGQAAPRWERAIAEGPALYAAFRISLQLVDRGGAVSATRLADFRDLVFGIAGQIKADTTVPDVPQTHQRAVELDAFCAEVDQMVGVNLVMPGERLLSGARVAEAAALLGMKLEADGAFHLLGAQGHSLFSLINMDNQPFQHHLLARQTTNALTLLLDVPRVEQPAAQFDRMLSVAQSLARELQLSLVDDHRVVLTETGLSRIRSQIAAVEDRMRERGVAPGSVQARRLFS